MRWVELQTSLHQAMLAHSPDPALLALLAGPTGERERRLAVYRNNVRHALLNVLEAAFPVIRQLIGEACFTAVGLTFVAQHPPQRPVLYAYGGGFPGFLAAFQPLADLPWLADIARLEWARNEALFAPEAPLLTPTRLAAVPPEQLPGLSIWLHPSARLLQSRWPIHAIWDAHQPDGGPLDAVDLKHAQSVLVWRLKNAVVQQPLSAGEFVLLTAFAAHRPLAEAAETAAGDDATFDLATALARFLNQEVLAISDQHNGNALGH